jgi:hypothetical protein
MAISILDGSPLVVVYGTQLSLLARRYAATCPKSWRYSFATLLQVANVDPLIRQQVMGHKPTNPGGLGMTANSMPQR